MVAGVGVLGVASCNAMLPSTPIDNGLNTKEINNFSASKITDIPEITVVVTFPPRPTTFEGPIATPEEIGTPNIPGTPEPEMIRATETAMAVEATQTAGDWKEIERRLRKVSIKSAGGPDGTLSTDDDPKDAQQRFADMKSSEQSLGNEIGLTESDISKAEEFKKTVGRKLTSEEWLRVWRLQKRYGRWL